jgi:hypothetical protein
MKISAVSDSEWYAIKGRELNVSVLIPVQSKVILIIILSVYIYMAHTRARIYILNTYIQPHENTYVRTHAFTYADNLN